MIVSAGKHDKDHCVDIENDQSSAVEVDVNITHKKTFLIYLGIESWGNLVCQIKTFCHIMSLATLFLFHIALTL